MTPTPAAAEAAPIDPVASPDAYRRELLSWLGADDPAVVQGATAARLREIVEAAGDRLRIRPEPREWSVVECVGHLVDSELVAGARVRWILAEDEPDIVGYDQDRWVAALRHNDDDPGDLVALFEALRGANLRLWAASSPADRERFGRHRERGPDSWSGSRPATTGSTSPRPSGPSRRSGDAEVRRPAGSGPSRRGTRRARRWPPG